MSADLLGVAVEAVRRATTTLHSRPVGRAHAKGDRDLVTDLDRVIEEEVRAFLAHETPNIGFLGEESGASGDQADGRWVLDPIDGTSNIVHGLPMYAVSLAFVRDDTTQVAVVDLPAYGTRYTATLRGGAFRDGEPIHTSGTTDLTAAVVSLGDYAVGPGAEAKNAERIALTARLAGAVERLRMLGSACTDLAWVADGALDAAVISSNKPWDTAAGVLLAREAGAVVVDRGGEPHTTHSTSTVALAPGLLEALLALVGRRY